MRKLLFLENELEERKRDRPPSKFMDTCIAKVTREGDKPGRKKPSDPGAICANIWYHGLTPKGKKRVKKRGMSESEHVIAEAVVAEMIADEPELDEELTKQHFIRIASILKPHTRTPAGERIAGDLADFFAGENPRFDRDRFLKAAGVGAERERLAASADEDHRDDDDDEEPKRGQRLGRLTIPWDDDPELGGREV